MSPIAHYVYDGMAGCLPDIPLACGIILGGGVHLTRSNSYFYKLHERTHAFAWVPVCFCFGLLFHNRLLRAWAMHVAFDWVTHMKGWNGGRNGS